MWSLFSLSFLVFASSSNWFTLWISMEMNTLTFIGVFSLEKNKSEPLILYFIVQSLGSFFLLSSFLWAEAYGLSASMSMILILSLLMKLGMAPFHNWVPPLILNSNKVLLFSLLIMQKIIPFLWIIVNKVMHASGFIFMALINMFMISPQNIMQSSLNMIIGFSSMSHSSWILMSTLSLSIWEMYFLVYTIIFSSVIFLSKNSLKTFIQNNKTYWILIMLFTLGGIPPFMGFYPKLMVLQEMMWLKVWMAVWLLLMLSLIDLFIYARLGVLSTLNSKKKMMWKMSQTSWWSLIMINILMTVSLWV